MNQNIFKLVHAIGEHAACIAVNASESRLAQALRNSEGVIKEIADNEKVIALILKQARVYVIDNPNLKADIRGAIAYLEGKDSIIRRVEANNG